MSARAGPLPSERRARARSTGRRIVRTLIVFAAVAAGSAHAADAVRGKTLYENRCIACHSIDANRVGPAHRGVVGRKAGTVKDYEYSPALKAAVIVWDARSLERWLADPEKLIPGQRMGYSVPEAADRADLVEYLRLESRR
jgi:cytochrome c